MFKIKTITVETRGKKKKIVDAKSNLEFQGIFKYSLNYGLIRVDNKTLLTELKSIKMFYSNGQAENIQEIRLIQRTDKEHDMANLITPSAKFFEFDLNATDRNVLQNSFTFSMKYKLNKRPDVFSTKLTTRVSFIL